MQNAILIFFLCKHKSNFHSRRLVLCHTYHLVVCVVTEVTNIVCKLMIIWKIIQPWDCSSHTFLEYIGFTDVSHHGWHKLHKTFNISNSNHVCLLSNMPLKSWLLGWICSTAICCRRLLNCLQCRRKKIKTLCCYILFSKQSNTIYISLFIVSDLLKISLTRMQW